MENPNAASIVRTYTSRVDPAGRLPVGFPGAGGNQPSTYLAAVPVSDVVQVYLHDPVAEVARPVQALVAAHRVDLALGETTDVTITLRADQTSYTGAAGRRQVDPGEVELRVGASSADIRGTIPVTMTGPRRHVGFDRVMRATVASAVHRP